MNHEPKAARGTAVPPPDRSGALRLENARGILQDEVDARLAEFSRKRFRDKWKAFFLRLTAVGFGAIISVLAGVSTDDKLQAPIKNAVLVLGALTVVVNAWDAFFDHRALWVKRTITVARLKQLKRDLDFEMAIKSSADDGLAQLRGLKARLEEILTDDHRSWIQLRDEAREQNDPKGSKAKVGETKAAS